MSHVPNTVPITLTSPLRADRRAEDGTWSIATLPEGTEIALTLTSTTVWAFTAEDRPYWAPAAAIWEATRHH